MMYLKSSLYPLKQRIYEANCNLHWYSKDLGLEISIFCVFSDLQKIRMIKVIELRPISIQLIFLSQAFLFASWVTRLPDIQVKFDISDGQTGYILLALPFGALAGTLMAGLMSTILSLKLLNFACLIGLAICSSFIGLALTIPTLIVVLTLLGVFCGAIGVAMNAAAIEIEKQVAHPIIMRCHGHCQIKPPCLMSRGNVAF